MRRSTVIGLVGAILVIGIGAYSAFWWIAAGKIEAMATAWRDSTHPQNIKASWDGMRVAGYPLAFRLELANVALQTATLPATDLRAPSLSASVRPWNFHAGWFDAPDGLTATLGPAASPVAKIVAEHAGGAVAMGDNGATMVWLSLYRAKADAAISVGARTTHVWLTLPARPPTTGSEPGIAFAASLRELALPVTVPGFNPTIDDLGFGVTVMGAVPAGPLAQAATAWRNAGGTVELNHLDVRWGDMQINGAGTLALDNDLQPTGGISGGIAGFDQLLTALVAAGRVKAGDARVARLALAMLAKTGPNGRPEIATSFAIQNGEMFLGPAKLGRAPRIDW